MSLILEKKELRQSILTKEKTGNKSLDQNDGIIFMSKGKTQVKSCNLCCFIRSKGSKKAIAMATKGARGFTLLYVSIQS